MLLKQDIYTLEKYKSQIQKYALSTDDFSHGVYRTPKEKALTKKYIGYNNHSFVNGLVFDIDHELGAISWEIAGLPMPNTIIQNTTNGHAHLLYALQAPVLKTDSARMKPIKLAAAVQAGFTERLKADRAYADVLMKNPLNANEWRTLWTHKEPYELYYLSEFIPDSFTVPNKRSNVGLGRNVNLFEDLRKIGYKEVLKYKRKNSYDSFFNEMIARATLINNHCNPNNPLPFNEVKQVCNSICKWTWRNFSDSQFSKIQSERAKKNTKPRKAKMLINFIEGL